MKKPIELFLGALAIVGAIVAVFKSGSSQQATGGVSSAPPAIPPGQATALVDTGSVALPRDAKGVVGTLRASSNKLWIDVLSAVVDRIRRHNIVMIAASLSYYALLAVFPAAIAAVSIYGLVADPDTLEEQIVDLTSALPDSTAEFIAEQLRNIVMGSGGSLGLVTAFGILVALFSASAGTKATISGTNIAYGVKETRSFLQLRGVAYGLTVLIIVGLSGSVIAVTALPQIAEAVGLADVTRDLINVLRYPAVFVLVVIGLGGLYKWAPDRPARLTKFVNVGGVVAAILWVLATVLFSLYVNNFGTFGETYGTLAGLIVLMLWFFISGLVVLAGAELNSELEQRRQLPAS